MKKEAPEKYRMKLEGTRYASTAEDGMNGAFTVPLHHLLNSGHAVWAHCIVSDGTDKRLKEKGIEVDWEHVSVHVVEFGRARTPSWAEMCAIKDLFWEKDEVVVQYHPAKSDYVNLHPNVLHLWKRRSEPFPTPPLICV